MGRVNPAQQADKPPLPHPDPKPPSPEEAARLVERAFSQDPDWGAFVWVQMTTGMRRGEICGLRWSHVDLNHAVLTIRRPQNPVTEHPAAEDHLPVG